MIYTILVNWKGWRDTLACLHSLAVAQHDGLTVLVCDNDSGDESLPEISRWAAEHLEAIEPTMPASPQVRRVTLWRRPGHGPEFRVGLVENKGNYGFAGGNNTGIALAVADPGCDFVFLLNNDTEVAPDAILQLRDKLERHPDIAMCGATLVYHDNPHMVQTLGGTYSKLGARAIALHANGPVTALPAEADIESAMDYVCGAAIFARASFLRRTGGLCDHYFLYYEELDLSRHLRAGERMGWAKGALISHKVGGSIGTGRVGARASDLSIYYDHRSKTRYYWRYLRGYLPFLTARLMLTTLAYGRRGDMRAVRAMWLGVLDCATKHHGFRRAFPKKR